MVVVVVVVAAVVVVAEVQIHLLALVLNLRRQYHPRYQYHRPTYFVSPHVVLIAVDLVHHHHLHHRNHRR